MAALGAAQAQHQCWVSPITAWEAALGERKLKLASRPDLQGLAPQEWFRRALLKLDAAVLPLEEKIAFEVAAVPAVYGHGDPGDCFMIATARVHGLTLITHDVRMIALSKRRPDYISVLAC